MNDIESTQKAWALLGVPFVAFSVIVGYTAPQLLDHAAPGQLALGGFLFGAGLVATYFLAFVDFREPWFTMACIIFGAGFVIIGNALLNAHREHAVNVRRCQTIQVDMLSARPRLSNGADVFQALGCKASGTDPRIFVPPSERLGVE